ncbi:ubiquitin-conjugating enzyme E2 32-like [Apium graveolens]|uniref:ubiquitin-conjugating enzyme E2 32-like n=1 Tax=Apium graveolens TaxID=4045 RepID=UPI003D79A462
MAEEKYNRKNPSVKRILQELKEMQSNPSDDFMSLPLEENIFEWQFAIRGPSETEFEGGIYHGRIQLPSEYPFKPPSFMLLTPNGRFETQTKICLSISNHHPEHWQPSWSVRTALTALIAFMPTNPSGALGSLDYKKEERRVLAVKSREAAPNFGNPERQKLIDEIHDYMLSKAPPVPELGSTQDAEENSTVGEAGPLPAGVQAESEELQNPAVDDRIVEQQDEGPFNANPAERIVVARQVTTGNPSEQHQLLQRPATRVQRPADDWLFTLAAVGLTIAIAYLLVKKFLKASEFGTFSMNGS